MDTTGVNETILLDRSQYEITDFEVTITDSAITTAYNRYKVLYTTTPTQTEESPWHTGRWEWTVIGDFAKPSDSLGAAMVTAAMGDWKNKQTWLSGLDICSKDLGPCIPMVMREFDNRTVTKEGYYHNYPDDMRSSFRDDWCTLDAGQVTQSTHTRSQAAT